MFKIWESLEELNSLSPLLNQWFVGGFMHGKQSNELPNLLEAFKKLREIDPPTMNMTLYRVSPYERTVHNLVETELHLISSWSETEMHARQFYGSVSMDRNSPVKNKSHALFKSVFSPQEILVVVNSLLPKLDAILTDAERQDNFPYRLGNLHHSMDWHKNQREVIVSAPGKRTVKIIDWL